MYTQTILLSVLVAIAEARFGQEQIPIPAIQAVTSGGNPGEAATLAGQSISFLLGAANPCGKLQQADKIIETLGTGADSLAAAKGLVAAEQNVNNFVATVPTICSDPSLPKTQALRGIVPLIDPAFANANVQNANSAKSLNNPFDSNGLSVADIMAANGFTDFVTKALDGSTGAPAGGNGNAGNANAGNANNNADNNADNNAGNNNAGNNNNANNNAGGGCPTTLVTVTRTVAAAPTAAAGNNNNNADNNADNNNNDNNNNDNNNAGNNNAGGGGAAFGSCDPTIKFEGGLGGRPQTEFTFQSNDAQIAAGQQEALNPNIITNKICDSLTNFCGASAAGKATCLAAKATVLASGKRDASVVDLWKNALGL